MASGDAFALPERLVKMMRVLCNKADGELMTDIQERLHYFEITGAESRAVPSTGARANPAACCRTLELIEDLSPIYGQEMHRAVVILTPYTLQLSMYRRAFDEMREKGWEERELPKVMTIDQSVGQVWDHVIIDYTCHELSSHFLDFASDLRRMTTAHTRVRKMQWIVGVDFKNPADPVPNRRDLNGVEVSSYAQLHYYSTSKSLGCLSSKVIEVSETDWPQELRRTEQLGKSSPSDRSDAPATT